jgi:hypothetical protein
MRKDAMFIHNNNPSRKECSCRNGIPQAGTGLAWEPIQYDPGNEPLCLGHLYPTPKITLHPNDLHDHTQQHTEDMRIRLI